VATLRQLEARLASVAQRLELGVSAVIGTVGVSIGAELVPATPVDTGYARANWRPSLNAPAEGPLTALDPTGAATVARIGAVAKRFRPGDTFFIVNNAPYIGRLNAGSSPQAAAGFVQEAVRRGTARALAAFEGKIISRASTAVASNIPRDPRTGRFISRS
jgi:hypothetical protein